jgi:cellulose synthase/poly-beta-1,6-N-acetylglucosamine synthase-like glycosyltransferase
MGKSAVLTAAMPEVRGEIVAFTDANSRFEPEALRALVAPFQDSTVGCVVGELTYINTDNPRVNRGEGLYWRYENAIKRLESDLGSTIVANGSIYAVRRALIRVLPTHVDFDSMLPLQVLRGGHRVVFEPRSRAMEKAAETLAEEFERKVRIINQQIWGLIAARGMIGRGTWGPASMIFCHKVLRWSVPLLLLANLSAALILALEGPGFGTVAVVGHVLLAGAASAGWILDRAGLPAGWLWVATYFWAVNLASLAALLSCLGGRRILAWEKASTSR